LFTFFFVPIATQIARVERLLDIPRAGPLCGPDAASVRRMAMPGSRRPRLETLTPGEVSEKLALGEIVLVDVREAAEFARGHIEGALSFPLSSFDPAGLPRGRLVFHCAGGRRGAIAAESARKAGCDVAGHMEAGIAGWVGSGLKLAGG
jgi:rhodanese-related sulfurtransferase